MDEELQRYREEIRKTDEQMALLFLRRMQAAGRIFEIKKRLGMPIEDPEQEKKVIHRNLHIIPEGDLTALYTDFITHVIGLSRQYQKMLSGEASENMRR